MLLNELIDRAALRDAPLLDTSASDSPPTSIEDVTHDTARLRPGSLYVCIRGRAVDGHDLAREAIAAGAVALVVDHALDVGVPQLVVADPRAAMAALAVELWGDPSREVAVVGVTGTNAKTTVTHLVAEVVRAMGGTAAVLGTLSGPHTTPESSDLQRWLAAQRDAGVATACIEVSSHGLAYGRVAGVHFAVGVFTNLGRDHLDEHGDMESYFAAKARLFERHRTDAGVVCVDDTYGRRLLSGGPGVPTAPAPLRGYGLADAGDVRLSARGSTFSWRAEQVHIRLVGRFNVQNAVAAATVAEVLGHPVAEVAAALEVARPVPGRFQAVEGPAGSPAVVVDYAHTPDALETALRTARDLSGGKVIVVFGCGGDRDSGKRPLMGAVAARGADLTVATSDNPRSEDPEAILASIADGWRQAAGPHGALVVEPDRRTAIAMALAAASPSDVVVIAGKGHETTQTIGDRVIPFDDSAVAAELLGGPEVRSP